MSITHWWEIICNGCGNAEHYANTKRDAEYFYRQPLVDGTPGGIITKDGKHYCCKDCQNAKIR